MIRSGEWFVILLYLVPMIWAVTHALRTPEDIWEAAGQNQMVWVVIILLAPLLGPALYYVIARPRLRTS